MTSWTTTPSTRRSVDRGRARGLLSGAPPARDGPHPRRRPQPHGRRRTAPTAGGTTSWKTAPARPMQLLRHRLGPSGAAPSDTQGAAARPRRPVRPRPRAPGADAHAGGRRVPTPVLRARSCRSSRAPSAHILARVSMRSAASSARIDPARQEYESIRTALANLPGPTETAPERVRQRMREKEVIRRRLAQLVEASGPGARAIEADGALMERQAGDPRSFDRLDRLLAEQPYRLAHWRVAAEEINYRRFFESTSWPPSAWKSRRCSGRRTASSSWLVTREGHRTAHRPSGRPLRPSRLLPRAPARALRPRASARGSGGRRPWTGRRWRRRWRRPPIGSQRLRARSQAAGVRPLYVVAEKVLGAGRAPPGGLGHPRDDGL